MRSLSHPHDLQALKQRLTVPEAWTRLGLSGVPCPHCRSPFRQDRTPSFSIYAEGRRWVDHSTGEGGDVIDFIAKACGVDNAEAVRRFRVMAGAPAPIPTLPGRRAEPSSALPLKLPPLLPATAIAEACAAVAETRGLAVEAVHLAHHLRVLVFAEVCGFPCWLLTDPARRIAEARRIDGQPFPACGTLGPRKAHTLRGSCKSWPAGVDLLRTTPSYRAVMMVEGGPDYLAALHFALLLEHYDLLPVAMLGRSTGSRIDPQALALLKGRRIRLYPHADPDGGGLTASQTWGDQLSAVGCQVDLLDFTPLRQADGRPVKDLNDAVFTDPTGLPHLSSQLLP